MSDIKRFGGLTTSPILHDHELFEFNKLFPFIKKLCAKTKILGLWAEDPCLLVKDKKFVDFGKHEKVLKQIGNYCKKNNIRIIFKFDQPRLGLANPDKNKSDWAKEIIYNLTYFLELCHLDYNSLVFIPYGKVFTYDTEFFEKKFSSLPTYIKNRIGFAEDNFYASMFFANKYNKPFIYKLCEGVPHPEYMKYMSEVHSKFSLRPDINPILEVMFKEEFKIDCMKKFNGNFDIMYTYEGLDFKKKKKLRVKNEKW